MGNRRPQNYVGVQEVDNENSKILSTDSFRKGLVTGHFPMAFL